MTRLDYSFPREKSTGHLVQSVAGMLAGPGNHRRNLGAFPRHGVLLLRLQQD